MNILSLFYYHHIDALAFFDPLMRFFHSITTSAPANINKISVPLFLEYMACSTGAVCGAARAHEKNLDIVGAVVLGIITGFGGGLVRDIMLPTDRIYMLDSPGVVFSCVFFSAATFYFKTIFNKFWQAVLALDIISVGLFAFLGADKALTMGYNGTACVILGTITAVGGGMLRDVCLGEVPQLFLKGNFYAIAGFLGACTYILLLDVHFIKVIAALACLIVTVGTRLISLQFNLCTKNPKDYSGHLMKPFAFLMSITPRRIKKARENASFNSLGVEDKAVDEIIKKRRLKNHSNNNK